MNIIVSGGSGYIGSFLIKQLIEQGHNIGLITRSENEFTKYVKQKICVYKTDVTKPFVFEPKENYDIFIHLAAANDIDSATFESALSVSALGTRNALEFCKKNFINKIIYFSTFQVFGRVEGEINENSVPLPMNDYAITHLFAEQYIEMFSRTSQIDYIILRPTNIFGSPICRSIDRWTLVPLCFCKEAFEKGEINLTSSGNQIRDFIDVNDLVKVTEFYCNNFGKFMRSIVNVSSGNNFSIIEIAKIVAEIFEDLFQNVCKINIHSTEPKVQNVFTINREKISQTNFEFGTKEALKGEIIKTFKLLKK